MERPIRLRRSILSVPANRERLVRKAFTLPTDVIMLDLEDSVPVTEKDAARLEAVRIFQEADFGGKVRAYRINAMDTPWAYRDIIDVMEAVGDRVDVLVVPKVNDASEIKAIDYLLRQIELRMERTRTVGLEASVETASGMLRVDAIAFSSPRLEALVFGIADYAASLTMPSRGVSGHGDSEGFYPGHRWHFPLSRMAMAAKAAGLAAIDAPYGDYRDPDGLKRSCNLSCALGYDGKWAIHPDQLAIINDAYSPAREDVERARLVVQAYEAALQQGIGSVAVDGKMVDAASIRVAKMTCAHWDSISGDAVQSGSGKHES
jgi:citrate lyase beta subunit